MAFVEFKVKKPITNLEDIYDSFHFAQWEKSKLDVAIPMINGFTFVATLNVQSKSRYSKDKNIKYTFKGKKILQQNSIEDLIFIFLYEFMYPSIMDTFPLREISSRLAIYYSSQIPTEKIVELNKQVLSMFKKKLSKLIKNKIEYYALNYSDFHKISYSDWKELLSEIGDEVYLNNSIFK